MAATANRITHHPVLKKLEFCLAFAFLAAGSNALASDWRITPSINLGGQLTDNVYQTPDAQKQSALVLTATPAIDLNYKGSSRLKADLQYSLTDAERFTQNNGNDGDFIHQLNGYANAELAKDLFYIDTRANVSQFRNSLLSAPGNGILNGSNQSTAGTYSISPYLTKRFGTFATGLLKYTNSGALFDTSAINNINSNTIQGAINSGTRFNELSWALNYSFRDEAVRNGPDNQFEHYDVTAGYILTHHVRIFGSAGYDNNDYFSFSKTSGPSWNAGLTWSPSRRTSLQVSGGHSYYGNTYGLNFNYRSHFAVWTASYSESVSDISQQVAQATGNVIWQCSSTLFMAGSPSTPPQGCSNGTVVSLGNFLAQGLLAGSSQQDLLNYLFSSGVLSVGLTNGVFLNKNFNSGVYWAKGKNSLGLNIFDTRRNYLQLGPSVQDETRGVSAVAGHKLDAITTLSVNLSYTNNKVPALLNTLGTDSNDDVYVASVGVTRQFQRKLYGTLAYRYTTRNSNINAYDFTENNLSASVNYSF